jgi:hypothetical protein
MRPLRRILLAAAVLLPAIALLAVRAQAQAAPGTRPHRPGVQYMRGAAAAAAAPESPQPNLTYFGGPVFPNTTTYAIWWGKPSDFPSDAREKLDDFLEGLDGSAYLAIADQYMLGEKTHTHFGGNLFDASAPTAQTDIFAIDADVNNEVAKVLQQYGMKPDPLAVYMVYTTNFPHFNNLIDLAFCAFHDANFAPDGTIINYAYLPNPAGISTCGFYEDPFIARNPISKGVGDLASATAHEFMETITDAEFDGWHDPNFVEVGDPCAYQTLSGVPLEGSKWQLQTIWSNQVSGCVQGGSHDVRILGALSNFGGIATFDISDAAYGTFAESINQEGTSVGSYEDANLVIHAFMRDNLGHITMIDPPGAAETFFGSGAGALGINAEGVITGYYTDASAVSHGFVRDKRGNFTTIDAPGAGNVFGTGTFASSINNEGEVAGSYTDANSVQHGYVRDSHGNFTTFDASGASAIAPGSINEEGAVAGGYLDTNSVHRGFVRDARGNITPFDAPGASHAPGAGTFASSINDEGVVAGYFTDAKFVQRAFLRDEHGKFTTFDAPGADFGTVARAINAQGLVAGYFSDEHGNARGFVRDKNGNFITLGALVTSINAKGGIAGYYSAPIK